MPNPRKPSHLKVVSGTYRRDRAPRNEPRPARVARPRAPAHLSPAARKAWAAFSVILDRAGVLTEMDSFALEGLAESYADLLRARAALPEDGSLTYEVITKAGGTMIRAYPEVAIAADADRRFAMWLSKFGLDPASRSKVEAAVTYAGNNPFRELDNPKRRR